MKNIPIILSILVALGLIAGALFLTGDSSRDGAARGDGTSSDTLTTGSAGVGQATMEGDVQYVDITARGGYDPRVTKAQAGVPTVIRMKTNGTYDCSMALAIPDIGYQSYLKPSGVEEIQVPADKAQGTLKGLCSMAMYHFQIDFE